MLLRPGDGTDPRGTPGGPFEVEGLLGTLAAIDEELPRATGRRRALLLAERRETLRSLDASASPAVIAGGATLIVTLYAGSPAEQRWTFRIGARDVGEHEVGSFLVTESMLVRRSAP